MKTTIALVLYAACLTVYFPLQAQQVNFNTSIVGAKIVDFDGKPLTGTNFWVQLYSADGLTATFDELQPAGLPIGFRGAASAGFVQTSGTTAQGNTVNPTVNVSTTQAASVQIRAWSGAFTSYEAAKNGGGRIGSSRILRMTTTGNPFAQPPTTAVDLIDANGPVNGFSLGFGISALSINDLVLAEGTNGTVQANFTVGLTTPSDQTITVAFATVDGSAVAGSDYVATNGTLTFTPGQTNKTISITVTAGQPVEVDEDFSVILTNAVKAALLRPKGTALITQVHISSVAIQTAVSFNTIAGRFYVVEQTENPAMTGWTALPGASNILGVGGMVTVIDPGAGCSSARFYRARLIE